MIEIITAEDFNKFWKQFIKVKERSLRQTKQIKELQKEVRELKK